MKINKICSLALATASFVGGCPEKEPLWVENRSEANVLTDQTRERMRPVFTVDEAHQAGYDD